MQLVKIAARCCAASIMIEFVEVDAFGTNFILVVVRFRNILSRTFNATVGEDTTPDLVV